MLLRIALAVLALALVLVSVRLLGLAAASRRTGGPTAVPAELAPCPRRPNCVSSRAAEPRRRVAPIAVAGGRDAAMAAARRAIEATPRATVLAAEGGYLRAEYRSALFGFVDDLELLWDEAAGAFDVRSASREGYSDLGVNRRRVEELRQRLAAPG